MINIFIKKDSAINDTNLGFLPWITAFMVFLACITLYAFLSLNTFLKNWDNEISNSAVIQIIPDLSKEKITEDLNNKTEKAKTILEKNKNISNIKLLNTQEMEKLLSPWIGENINYDEINIPKIIEITFNTKIEKEFIIKQIETELKEINGDFEIETYKSWTKNMYRMINAFKILSTVIILFITIAIIATVIYATKTNLKIHKPYIEILHLIGAKDSFIANKFALHTLGLSIFGSILGLIIAIPTTAGISKLANSVSIIQNNNSINLKDYMIISLIPVITSLISVITAKITVYKTLNKMV